MDQDKRRYRLLKRDVKQAGTGKMRRHLKRALTNRPEDAAETAFDYGRNSSASLNGNDRDATRRRSQLPTEDSDSAEEEGRRV
jgi:hypothetical protein